MLPRSQFVVTGPNGLATLDPPTFRLTVELADGTTETLEPPGDKTDVCFALQLERFVDACRAGDHPSPASTRRSQAWRSRSGSRLPLGVARLVPA